MSAVRARQGLALPRLAGIDNVCIYIYYWMHLHAEAQNGHRPFGVPGLPMLGIAAGGTQNHTRVRPASSAPWGTDNSIHYLGDADAGRPTHDRRIGGQTQHRTHNPVSQPSPDGIGGVDQY